MMPRLPVVIIIIIIYDNDDDDDLTYSDAADRGKIVRPVLIVVRENNNGTLQCMILKHTILLYPIFCA